mmetsp:Transcript_47833/g.89538  ORF Transcript_47833/g.89538 Transcript_47833/m.89538 type:complete len:235 (+) Transcript_47833:312-1016(+)
MHALLGAGALCRCHKAHIAGRALQKQPDGLLHAEEVLGFLRGAGQALLDLHILGEELVKGGLAALELELLRHAGAEPGGVTVDVVCIELFHSRLALGAGAVVGHGAVGHGLDHRCRSLLDGVRNGRIHQLLGDRAVHKLQALEQSPGRKSSHPFGIEVAVRALLHERLDAMDGLHAVLRGVDHLWNILLQPLDDSAQAVLCSRKGEERRRCEASQHSKNSVARLSGRGLDRLNA